MHVAHALVALAVDVAAVIAVPTVIEPLWILMWTSILTMGRRKTTRDDEFKEAWETARIERKEAQVEALNAQLAAKDAKRAKLRTTRTTSGARPRP